MVLHFFQQLSLYGDKMEPQNREEILIFMCTPLDEEKNGYVARDQLLYAP